VVAKVRTFFVLTKLFSNFVPETPKNHIEMNYLDLRCPKRLQASIQLPASKSISNRALIINALSENVLYPQNVSDCDDTRVTVAALARMPRTIDVGAAGTAMRFLTAFLSVLPGTHTITGTARMCQRPIGVLVDALRSLGAQIDYAGEEGYPPLSITGSKIKGGNMELPGNVSSQYVSALLMIAPTMEDGLTIQLKGNIVSRPYIDMTLNIMNAFGASASWTSEQTIKVNAQAYRPMLYHIENDWSAASYWYEMVALSQDKNAEIELPGLYEESTQGDSRVKDFFIPLGVKTTFKEGSVWLCKSGSPVSHLELDLVNQPDLAQTLVATCVSLGTTFQLTGLQNLKIKETDRIQALITEMRKLGFVVEETEEGTLTWSGERTTPREHPAIDTYEDHRMAMALAPCCMRLGELRINNPSVVSKSYPAYWDDLKKAGFTLSVKQ